MKTNRYKLQTHYHHYYPGDLPSPEVIRDARAASGLTQTAAARLVYCTLRRWQAWEAGEHKMHPALFELFLRKLPVTGPAP